MSYSLNSLKGLYENYYNTIGWYILGLYRGNGKEYGSYYHGVIGFRGYIGVMEKRMETTIMGL